LIGRTLLHYHLEEKIGEGGMGVVYKARDTRLDRSVAIKILPQVFATDRERLRRFEREAKLLASITHPNIAAIYGLEQADGKPFLVLEMVYGTTLAEALKKGRFPLDETLDICRQIAEGLEAAHESGIIHRDLKPSNIKLTPEGKVRILDFGLAKACHGRTPASDPSRSPTITGDVTDAGVILGTAAYMSPEQARGKAVDKRTDIWALGCILFECLTGKAPFRGGTIAETLASVIKDEPEWGALPESTPENLRRLLRRCLQKDANSRLHDVADVRIEIGDVIANPLERVTRSHRADSRWLVAALSIMVVTGVLVYLATRMYSSAPPGPVARLAVVLPPGDQLVSSSDMVAISPDGLHLAYVATRAGSQQIYLRAIDSLESVPVSGSEGGTSLFFSPDSRSLGFFANGKLKRVSVTGGAPLDICEALQSTNGASWGPSDLIVFGGGYAGVLGEGFSGLRVVSAGGGTPRILTTPDRTKGEVSHFQPEFLPDGSGVLFTIWKGSTVEIAVTSLRTGKYRTIMQDAAHARFAPPDCLAFGRGDFLLGVPFDVSRLEIAGVPVPVAEGFSQVGNWSGSFGISSRGWLAYVPAVKLRLTWVDRRGTARPLDTPPGSYRETQLSPDDRKIMIGANLLVWMHDISSGTFTKVTHEGANWHPILTPDGRRVTFQSLRGGISKLVWKSADGSGAEELLTAEDGVHNPLSWSPDGRVLVFSRDNDPDPGTRPDIWELRLDGEPRVRPYIKTPADERAARFSPDGRWVAYVSNESGHAQVYVRPYPGPGSKFPIGTGTEPLWARDGRELFYRAGDKMMAVPVTIGDKFIAGKPARLFEGRYAPGNENAAGYDVTRDGEQFLMRIGNGTESAPTQIILVQSWLQAVKRLQSRQ
jgi:serine/threonine protein kinase